MPHVFNILFEQLKAASPTKNNTLNASEFKDFYEKCNLYLLNALENSDGNLEALRIIVCMIGALSIGEKAFDRYYQQSISFANRIMSYVRKNLTHLYQLVQEEEEEWILFYRGLAMLTSIELLQYKFNDANENKVIFLQEIPDPTRREVAANKLLSRLCKLGETIYGDTNWTDLFTMIDLTKSKINYFNLTNSLETAIMCITKASKGFTNYPTLAEHTEYNFENLISRDSTEGMIKHSLLLRLPTEFLFS